MSTRTSTTRKHIPLWIGSVLGVAACGPSVHDPQVVKTGEELFEFYCMQCHGSEGQGSKMQGIPSNRDTDLAALQVRHKVRGKEGYQGDMPTFEHLTNDELKKLSIYVKRL